ncbi:MAG: DUF202 domain-containing protein [Dermatophilaceae bacterium]
MTPRYPSPPSDPAAAQERTTLAWRRTGLALLAVTVTIGRLGLEVLPPVVVVVPTLGAAGAAGWVVIRAARSRSEVPDGRGTALLVLRDGRLPALIAVVVAAAAIGELAAVVARATGWGR